MTREALIVAAAGGSALLLAGAFAFQFLGGLPPCPLCIWQRWPHVAAVAIGIMALAWGWRGLAWFGALAAVTSAWIGVYHTGIERAWWAGPSSCTGGGLGGMSGSDLLDPSAGARLVMCDEVAWSLLGFSMASWNALASLGLTLLWIAAATRR